MKNKYFSYFILSLLIFSCSNNSKNGIDTITNNVVDSIDIANRVAFKGSKNVEPLKRDNKYSDLNYLNNIISQTKHSTDTIFLGFRMGMTKTEFINHIKKLINKGKYINYLTTKVFTIHNKTNPNCSDNTFYSIESDFYMYERIPSLLGDSSQCQEYREEGIFYFKPVFNKESFLVGFKINYNNDYDVTHISKSYNWLLCEISQNSSLSNDHALFKQAELYSIISMNSDSFMRENNNVLVYENSIFIEYIDKKTLLNEIRKKLIENQKR